MSIAANKASMRFYDGRARLVDRDRLTTYHRRKQEMALSLFPVGPQTRFLDVGCGTGWAVVEASRRAPQGWACGVDLSAAMIERARVRSSATSNLEFRVADAECLPYADGYFDCVLCTFSFHHCSGPVRALAEMRRVLRPAGVLQILETNRTSFMGAFRLLDSYFKRVRPGHVGYYSREELLAIVRGAGFENVRLVAAADELFRDGKIFASYMVVRGKKLGL